MAIPAVAIIGVRTAHADISNTRLDAWNTLELKGSAWLGGQGVDVYSNGPSPSGPTTDTYNCLPSPGTPKDGICPVNTVRSGIKWQCVELVNRLYLTKGWITAPWYGNGNTLVNNLPHGLTKEDQYKISYLNPGDVVTFYSDVKNSDGTLRYPDGHAAVIDSLAGSKVTLVNQNAVQVYSYATFSNGTLNMSGWAAFKVQAVIHHPVAAPPTTDPNQPGFYAGKIVQWDGEANKPQKTSWLVSSDLKRYWIPDGSTFNCLKSSGFPVAEKLLSSTLLDQLPDQKGQWARCGNDSLSTNQYLFRGSYLRSSNGQYTLQLQRSDGNLVLYGPKGALWGNAQFSDYLVMQTDNNLATYRYGAGATWGSDTMHTRATTLVVTNNGDLVLNGPGGVQVKVIYSHSSGTGGSGSTGTFRIAALTSDGTFRVKANAMDAQWTVEHTSTVQGVISGSLIGALTSDGTFWVKQGPLDAQWVNEYSNVAAGVLSDAKGSAPLRIGVLTKTGDFLVKEGGLSAQWTLEYSGVAAGYLDGTRVGVLTKSGTFLVKDGGLSAQWTTEYTGVKQGMLSGYLIGVLTTGGTLLVKQGGLDAQWVTEYSGATSGMVSDATGSTPLRIGVVTTQGDLKVKEGNLSAQWILEHTGTSKGVLSGYLIGALVNGTFWVKQGGTDAQWVNEYAGATAGTLWSAQ